MCDHVILITTHTSWVLATVTLMKSSNRLAGNEPSQLAFELLLLLAMLERAHPGRAVVRVVLGEAGDDSILDCWRDAANRYARTVSAWRPVGRPSYFYL